MNGYTASPDKDNKITFSMTQIRDSHNHDNKYSKLDHTHNYISKNGDVLGEGIRIGFGGGYNIASIGAGGNDCASLTMPNNLDITSWWGVSFTNTCSSVGLKTPAVSIDCRIGNLDIAGNYYVESMPGSIVGLRSSSVVAKQGWAY